MQGRYEIRASTLERSVSLTLRVAVRIIGGKTFGECGIHQVVTCNDESQTGKTDGKKGCINGQGCCELHSIVTAKTMTLGKAHCAADDHSVQGGDLVLSLAVLQQQINRVIETVASLPDTEQGWGGSGLVQQLPGGRPGLSESISPHIPGVAREAWDVRRLYSLDQRCR